MDRVRGPSDVLCQQLQVGAALSLLVGLLVLDSEEHWLDFDQELVGLSLLPLVVDWVVSRPLSHYQIRVV